MVGSPAGNAARRRAVASIRARHQSCRVGWGSGYSSSSSAQTALSSAAQATTSSIGSSAGRKL